MKITQLNKDLNTLISCRSDSNVVLMRFGYRQQVLGERHSKGKEIQHKTVPMLNWRQIETMKVNDMLEWLEDPMTAIVKFENDEK